MMTTPKMIQWLLRRLAGPERADDVLGDFEEAHLRRIGRRGRLLGTVLTGLAAVDMAVALLRGSRRRLEGGGESTPLGIATRRRQGIPLVSWLDFKLGLRMLARYPGLTVVGGLAMALGIAIGASVFQFVTELIFPDHPYADVDRIVGIQNVNTLTTREDPRALHDFVTWRAELRSIEHIGARQTGLRTNLDTGDGMPAPVLGVAISSSAFALAPIRPLLGRPLLPADEAPGAPAVAVLAYELWQARFGGDTDVVGRVVRLGGAQATVVGVMSPRFALHVPSNDFIYPPNQDLWVPFRLDPLAYTPGEGPRISVFGQLAAGATPEEAQAELATLGSIAAAESPETHRYLQPEILTFSNPFGIARGIGVAGVLTLSGVFIVAVMVMLCANVALLMFARAATREGELVVRSALGASRRRIVAQLFAEALALASVALVLGWVGASLGLDWLVRVMESLGEAADVPQPWVSDSLSPRTIGYAAALGLAGAVMAGVLPGVKVTGKRGAGRLQRFAGRGAVAPLGRLWNGIIVVQVALTAAFLPIAYIFGVHTWKVRTVEYGFPAAEYLAVRLEMDGDDALLGAASASGQDDFMVLYEARYRELARRVAAEPGVTGVTIGEQLPGAEHTRRIVEADALAGADPFTLGEQVQVAFVDPNFFEVIGARIVSGRGFGSADLGSDSRDVIVNQSFVRRVFGGGNAVGRRLRYPIAASPQANETEAPWLEIVGVVEDVAMYIDPTLEHNAGVYHPRQPAESYPIRMAVHVPGGPGEFSPRLRELAAQTSTALRVHQPVPMDRTGGALLILYDFLFRLMVLGGGFALLLTIAGVYSVLAFTVSRRTREIGVRVALGADRSRIVVTILSRMASQVALGVVLGAVPGLLIADSFAEGFWLLQRGGWGLGLVIPYVALVIGVCMLACIVPTRRALRIQPTEALAADA